MTRFFLRRPVTTWMIFLAFAVLAVYAIPRIEIEALPEVDLPSLTVSTRWQGASPKAVQRSLTRPIEEAVQNVHGVESVKSTSRAGQSLVEVEFRRGVGWVLRAGYLWASNVYIWGAPTPHGIARLKRFCVHQAR